MGARALTRAPMGAQPRLGEAPASQAGAFARASFVGAVRGLGRRIATVGRLREYERQSRSGGARGGAQDAAPGTTAGGPAAAARRVRVPQRILRASPAGMARARAASDSPKTQGERAFGKER